MFCVHCGTKLEDHMKFCPKCGAAASAPAAAPMNQAGTAPSPVANAETAEETKPAVNAQPPVQQQIPEEAKMHSERALPTDYRAVNVMEYGSHGWSYVYPNIDQNGRILADAADHGIGTPVIVKTITVKRLPKGAKSYEQSIRAQDIYMEMYVTDARVIFLCDKYDKGGSWYGGLTALALNAVERGVASARTKGKTLAGHIRYEWLKYVMYVRKTGVLSDEQMRFVYKDRAGTAWQIDVVLDKHVDSSIVANDIMHRAAALRKAMRDDDDVITQESRDFYTQHAHPAAKIQHVEEKNTFSSVQFPQNYLAPAGEGLNPEWRD